MMLHRPLIVHWPERRELSQVEAGNFIHKLFARETSVRLHGGSTAQRPEGLSQLCGVALPKLSWGQADP